MFRIRSIDTILTHGFYANQMKKKKKKVVGNYVLVVIDGLITRDTNIHHRNNQPTSSPTLIVSK